jgi:hypothetical protein
MSDVGHHRPRQKRNANNPFEPVYNSGDDNRIFWLRCPEAARLIRVSSKTLGRLAARGWIRSVTLPGGGPRIHRLYDVATIVRPGTDEAATNNADDGDNKTRRETENKAEAEEPRRPQKTNVTTSSSSTTRRRKPEEKSAVAPTQQPVTAAAT